MGITCESCGYERPSNTHKVGKKCPLCGAAYSNTKNPDRINISTTLGLSSNNNVRKQSNIKLLFAAITVISLSSATANYFLVIAPEKEKVKYITTLQKTCEREVKSKAKYTSKARMIKIEHKEIPDYNEKMQKHMQSYYTAKNDSSIPTLSSHTFHGTIDLYNNLGAYIPHIFSCSFDVDGEIVPVLLTVNEEGY